MLLAKQSTQYPRTRLSQIPAGARAHLVFGAAPAARGVAWRSRLNLKWLRSSRLLLRGGGRVLKPRFTHRKSYKTFYLEIYPRSVSVDLQLAKVNHTLYLLDPLICGASRQCTSGAYACSYQAKYGHEHTDTHVGVQ